MHFSRKLHNGIALLRKNSHVIHRKGGTVQGLGQMVSQNILLGVTCLSLRL